MEDETPARLYRAAMVHRAIRRLARVDLELLQETAEAYPGALVADADANGAILVVNTHGDDRALKARVGHSGHCEKQLSGQEGRLMRHAATMGRQSGCRKS
jgi:hypothetical protein